MYWVGTLLIGIGAAVVYAAGMKDGKRVQEREVWRDASDGTTDDSEVGSVADVRGKRHGFNPASHPA